MVDKEVKKLIDGPAPGDDAYNRLLAYRDALQSLSPNQRARVNFARTFRSRMQETDMTKTQLAEQLGVSSSLLSAWTSGVSLPRPDTMRKLSEFFGEDVSLWATDKTAAPPRTEPSGTVEEPAAQYEYPPHTTLAGMVGEPVVQYTAAPRTELTDDELALVQRVRRMSDEERDGLFALLHVLR